MPHCPYPLANPKRRRADLEGRSPGFASRADTARYTRLPRGRRPRNAPERCYTSDSTACALRPFCSEFAAQRLDAG